MHRSGGKIDLLIGTDFVDAFVQIHTLSGEPGELIAKRDCFGWCILGQVNSSRIGSVEVRTVSIEEDIAMKVTSEELDHSQPEWYLPLQAVFTPERTTKVCLVFDACSKDHDSLSLNDHLEKGPNYNVMSSQCTFALAMKRSGLLGRYPKNV